jgi:hypothetical protein
MNHRESNRIKQFFIHFVTTRFNLVLVSKIEYDDLKYFKDTTVGLYAIDQVPKSVSYDWILKNNFRINEPSYKGTFL